MGAYAKGNAVAVRGQEWADRQDPATRRGATIGWYRRFRESDGGLFAVLVAAYLFVTAIPAGVVMMSYVYNDPTELANRLSGRLNLTGGVKTMLDSVLAGASGHQLVATLIAVFDVLIFGLGFGPGAAGRHARPGGSTSVSLSSSTRPIPHDPGSSARIPARLPSSDPELCTVSRAGIGWVALARLALRALSYFIWMPRMLLHGVSRRDVVPGAVFLSLGLVGLRLLSALAFQALAGLVLDVLREPGHRHGALLLDHGLRGAS
jgi:hypothetical protein